MACGMVPVNGTVVEVGPVELAPFDTTYEYVAIRDESDRLREFKAVRAIPEVSALVQRDASGTFLFWDSPHECRLAFIYRADGAREVDFEALHTYFGAAST
ncbi:MAG TPA: hypothetical protein VEK73_01655 [Xanthobacteraceae bacterium]|nr:hypothetical protein [Xanthobacteraceae bacterium]